MTLFAHDGWPMTDDRWCWCCRWMLHICNIETPKIFISIESIDVVLSNVSYKFTWLACTGLITFIKILIEYSKLKPSRFDERRESEKILWKKSAYVSNIRHTGNQLFWNFDWRTCGQKKGILSFFPSLVSFHRFWQKTQIQMAYANAIELLNNSQTDHFT